MPTDIDFKNGKIINKRWKIHAKLGEGGCGSVYRVEDLQENGRFAALKAEPNSDDVEGILKMEVAVLKALMNRNNVIKLLYSGKRRNYNYIILTLCGNDLVTLRRKAINGFGQSTILRIALNTLYAIKQVHEVGFVHRDVKPGNIMNGSSGREARMFFLIDYGLSRCFVVPKNGKMELREPRRNVLFRGTTRYCSYSAHLRLEQGRIDDLWSLLYMLTQIYCGLPWDKLRTEEEIKNKKAKLTDSEVFKKCPKVFTEIASYLRAVQCTERPDYYKVYQMLMNAMRKNNHSLYDPYEWASDLSSSSSQEASTAIEYSQRELESKTALPSEELEFLRFPHLHPKNFQEVVLNL